MSRWIRARTSYFGTPGALFLGEMKFQRKAKEKTMTHQALRVCAIFTMFVAVASAAIYPPSPGDLSVAIPFQFIVGDKTMQAGNYLVHRDAETGVLDICEDGVYCATVVAGRVGADDFATEPQLVFKRWGESCVLVQIWFSEADGYQVPAQGPSAETVAATSETAYLSARELYFHHLEGLPVAWH